MSTTPKGTLDESLNESWVEVNYGNGEGSHSRSTPIHFLATINGNMEKLLWEAQRDSNQSSVVGSGVSSHLDSPKSLHSPANETNDMFLNAKAERQVSSDWIWDWSSRPDQQPPKEWKFKHPVRAGLSFRHSPTMKRYFSTEILSVLVFTNILSLLLGAGIGLYLGKRLSSQITAIPLD